MKKRVIVAAAAALMVAATLVPASANAADAGHSPIIVLGEISYRPSGLTAGGRLDVDASGTAYVADFWGGGIAKSPASGPPTVLVHDAPGLIGAIAHRSGTVYYTERGEVPRWGENPELWLMSVSTSGGSPKKIADLGAWYSTRVPDATNRYGFVGLPQSCSDQFGQDASPVRYGSSHYEPASAIATASGVFVADPGRNVVLKITYSGAISVAAVLPPAPATLASQELVTFRRYPDCAVGYRYIPEPGPTGIALGPDGNLYVTTIPDQLFYADVVLPGGLYRINPATGASTRIIGNLRVPYGVTAAPSGTLYIKEGLGGTNQLGPISVVRVNSRVARPLTEGGGGVDIRLVKDRLYTTGSGVVAVTPLSYR